MTDHFDLFSPVVTPFADAGDGVGRVDTDSLAALVEDLVDRGVDGFVPAGTTGEFAALDVDELVTVVETTVAATPPGTPVIAGASATSVPAVRRRLGAVADAGADAALLVAPYYDASSRPAGNTRFFEAVLEGADVPVYLYNIPATVGQEIDVATVRSLADRDDVLGIKDTSGDQRYFTELLRRTPESFSVYQGYDGGLVPGAALGADGAVSVLSQVMPETLRRAVAAVEDGDLATARRLQVERAGPVFDACVEFGFAAVMKAVLTERGVIADDAVRPPLSGVPDAARRDLMAALDRDRDDR